MPPPNFTPVDRTRWLAVIAIGLSIYMATLDMTIVATALPTIGHSLDSSATGTQWLLVAYNLPMIGLMIPLGRWVDVVGKRSSLLLAIVGFAVASTACGFAPNLGVLIALRVVQGTFAALIAVLVLAAAALVIAPKDRGKAMGLIGVIGPLGSVSGPVFGSLIVSQLSWPWLFFVNVPISAIAFGLVAATVRDTGKLRAPAPAWLGAAAIVAGAFTLLLLGIDSLTSGSAVAGVVMLAGAVVLGVVWSRTSDAANVTGVLRLPPLLSLDTSLLLVTMTGGSMFFLMPYILEQHMGRTAGEVGSIMFAMPLTMGVVSFIGGQLADKFGDWRAGLLGACLAVVGVALLFTQGEQWNTAGTMWRLAIVGAGMGLFVAPNQSATMKFAPRERMGTASSLAGLARNLGFTFGPACGAVVVGAGRSVNALLVVPLVASAGAALVTVVTAVQIRRLNRAPAAPAGAVAPQPEPVGNPE
ncbi:MFS transporter [Amycolatopsis australiensis]|uniref:Predicted arabinose efflux permease, MFS family n=1 Tax=Amycolatopsis australiensis TaxID=546364 RepID=A0A1K1S318_9PSEU|nr:MFS transporter [Amycolatopsis australiensis]SFW78492.1 Predicted arabinose efflux permease, MFS family [Amycolatopsis australiensis]